jgi:flagellar assembly protein FliH
MSSNVGAGFESFVYRSSGGVEAQSDPAEVSARPAPPQKTSGTEDKPKGEAELARLISQARAEGVRAGEQQARAGSEATLVEQRKQIEQVLSAFALERSEYYAKAERELVQLALAIASRILHRESQIDRMVVAGLAKVMLEKMRQDTKIKVRVHPGEASSWRRYFQDNESLEILEDATLAPQDCKLETELGVADLGLDAQLKEVEQGFFDLLALKPASK